MKLIQNLKINFIVLQFLFWGCCFSVTFVNAQKYTHTVVLDAGHGGKDPGKIGYRKYKEKDIALDIVLQIGKNLQKEKDIQVIYTRKKDVFVDLWERGRIANKADADLFVSVHCNAHNSQALGSETWVLGLHANKRNFEVAKTENEVILLEENYQEKYKGFNPNSPESVIGLTLEQEEYLDKSLSLAMAVQQNFKKDLKRTNRGVKQAGFVVLYQTYMPSVLIETGFLTNKKEGSYLNSKKGKLEMARAISDAIVSYVKDNKLNTVAVKTPKEIDKKKVKPLIDKVLFKVQIAAGKTKVETASYNFKGLNNVERITVKGLYKYYLGNEKDYQSARKILKKAKIKGYTNAFIVAFKGGVKVSLSEAIKSMN